jgi:lipoate-protein ligase A
MVEQTWRLVDTGMNDAFLNMAIDEAILETHLRGVCPPTVRAYGWSPPALSLGYFQDLEAEVEVRRCYELGIDLIRRLTGGRAVLHQDELTYSVVASDRAGFPRSLVESYLLINRGLIAAYARLGVEACLEAHPQELTSAACFSSAGLADLTCQGRKLCGSAQFRKDGALLQHGSLPITFDAQAFFSLLRFPSEAVRHRAQAAYGLKATSLSEISGNGTGYQQLRAALLAGFEDALGIVLREEPLTPEEWDLARQLAVDKYRSYGWNHYGRYEARMVSQTVS